MSVFKSGMDGKTDEGEEDDAEPVDEEANIGTAKVAQELAKDQSKFRNQFRGNKAAPVLFAQMSLSCNDAVVLTPLCCMLPVSSLFCVCALQSPCAPSTCARRIERQLQHTSTAVHPFGLRCFRCAFRSAALALFFVPFHCLLCLLAPAVAHWPLSRLQCQRLQMARRQHADW